MIVSKTPFRLSFAGGGSDIGEFYQRFGGAVVSSTIDKYMYVMVNSKFDNRIRVSYSRTEEADTVDQVEHPIVREALRIFQPSGGIEITSVADIPSQGTGLGSSSSFTVGLLNGLFAFHGRHASPEMLGQISSLIEIERCGQPIGKQDQYAAAFGGLNLIRFHLDGAVDVSPIVCAQRTLERLQRRLVLFYTGMTRSASVILQEQAKALRENQGAARFVTRMVDLALQLKNELQSDNVDALGEILHEGWMLKRSLVSGITSDKIDLWYNAARRCGAIGGKILGAGGGGFLLLYAPTRCHSAIAAALPNLRRIPVHFERDGSRIVFYSPSLMDSQAELGKRRGDAFGAGLARRLA